MPNPQQPELARSRKSGAVTDDALPTKATKRSKKRGAEQGVGPVPEDNAPGHHPDVVPDKPLVPPAQYRLRVAGDTEGRDLGDEGGPDQVRYRFLFDRALVPLSAAAGVLPMTASLTLDDDSLVVRFGPWSLRTSRDNIAGCEVTGPYKPWRVAGPPHLSLKDRGITFATSTKAGACIRFHEPVQGLLPTGVLRHPSATVTVTDPHDLCRRLAGEG
jgi:hypothetical protein